MKMLLAVFFTLVAVGFGRGAEPSTPLIGDEAVRIVCHLEELEDPKTGVPFYLPMNEKKQPLRGVAGKDIPYIKFTESAKALVDKLRADGFWLKPEVGEVDSRGFLPLRLVKEKI